MGRKGLVPELGSNATFLSGLPRSDLGLLLLNLILKQRPVRASLSWGRGVLGSRPSHPPPGPSPRPLSSLVITLFVPYPVSPMTISILVFLHPNKQNSLDHISSTLSLISFPFFFISKLLRWVVLMPHHLLLSLWDSNQAFAPHYSSQCFHSSTPQSSFSTYLFLVLL